jgi:hypothetical protein
MFHWLFFRHRYDWGIDVGGHMVCRKCVCVKEALGYGAHHPKGQQCGSWGNARSVIDAR